MLFPALGVPEIEHSIASIGFAKRCGETAISSTTAEILLFQSIKFKKHAHDKSLLLACSFVGISQLSCVAMRLSKPQPQQL